MQVFRSTLIATVIVLGQVSLASAGGRSSAAVARPGPVDSRGARAVDSLRLDVGEAFQVLVDELFRSSAGLRRRWQRLISHPRIALQWDGTDRPGIVASCPAHRVEGSSWS